MKLNKLFKFLRQRNDSKMVNTNTHNEKYVRIGVGTNKFIVINKPSKPTPRKPIVGVVPHNERTHYKGTTKTIK